MLAEARRDGRSPAIMWVLTNPAMGAMFDRVLVFELGQSGGRRNTRDTLAENGIFKELLS